MNGEDAGLDAVASRLHFSIGFDYVSQYFFRGIVQETRGAIIQPWSEFGIDLMEWDDITLSAHVGMWHSLHSKKTGATTDASFVRGWYEADWYAGLTLDIGEFSIGGDYTLYTSPNGGFDTIQEFAFIIGYDDSELWGGDFGLSPSLTFAFETSSGTATGSDRGVYMGIGIEPSWTFDIGEVKDFTLSVPLTIGLSLDDYFQDGNNNDSTFGFFDVGLIGSLPLPMPEGFGVWTISGGMHVLFLGNSTKDLNDNDGTEFIGTIGLRIEF